MVGLNFKGYTAQKGTFSMKHFFSKCDQIAGNCIFGHITQGIFKGKLNFLRSATVIFGLQTTVNKSIIIFSIMFKKKNSFKEVASSLEHVLCKLTSTRLNRSLPLIRIKKKTRFHS